MPTVKKNFELWLGSSVSLAPENQDSGPDSHRLGLPEENQAPRESPVGDPVGRHTDGKVRPASTLAADRGSGPWDFKSGHWVWGAVTPTKRWPKPRIPMALSRGGSEAGRLVSSQEVAGGSSSEPSMGQLQPGQRDLAPRVLLTAHACPWVQFKHESTQPTA